MKRPDMLEANTYSLKHTDGSKYFITISNRVNELGYLTPAELFINSLDLPNHYYLTAIERMINVMLDHNIHPNLIVDTLEHTVDYRNGSYFKNGKLFPSFISEISSILCLHFANLVKLNEGTALVKDSENKA